MWPVNLTPAQYPAYLRSLAPIQDVRMAIDVLDLSHRFRERLGPSRLHEWQTNIVSGETGIRRTLQTGLTTRLRLDLDCLLQAWVFVRVDELDVWAKVPVGMFRPSAPSYGLTTSVEAQDKMCLHDRGVDAAQIRADENAVEAVRSRLRAMGETRFAFPPAGSVKAKVPKDRPYGGPDGDVPAVAWRSVLSRAGQVFEYDALGRAWVYPRSAPPEGVDFEYATMGSPLAWTPDLASLRNRVSASGKGIAALSQALAAADPNSPESLAFGGVPWSNTQFERTEQTQASLSKWVAATLGKVGEESINVSLSGVPMWHVDPGARCTAPAADGVPVKFSLDTASLGPGVATYGYLSPAGKATLGPQKIRRAPKPKKKRRRR